MAILLSDSELDALAGLPSLPFRVYVQSIRKRMDFRTGFTGVTFRISYQAIKEDIYVEPAPGRVREPVSTDQLFRAVRVLESAGLVAIRSVMAAKKLIFQCLLAETLSHVQNKPATNPRLQPATDESSIYKGFDDVAATVETVKAATHRRSEYTSTYQSSSSTQPIEDDDDAHKCGEKPKPENVLPFADKEKTAQAGDDEKAFSGGNDLFYPSALNPDQVRGIDLKIKRLGSKRQAVLDELAGHMAKREIINPVRYVDFIIQKAELPVWVPELAGKVRAARERSAAAALARQKQLVAAPPVPVQKGSPMPENIISQFLKRKVS